MSTSGNTGLRYQGFDDTPIVLRRRAKELASSYNAPFCSVFLRAADELLVRRRCASDAETEAIEQLGNVLVLRRCLQHIAGLVAQSSMEKSARQQVAKYLNIAHTVKAPHKPKTILSIEIVKDEPFEAFLDRVKEQYDIHTGGATHGIENEEGEEAPQPEGPGRDADQHQRAEAEARGAGDKAGVDGR